MLKPPEEASRADPRIGKGFESGDWTFAEVPYCREQAGMVWRDSPSDHAVHCHCGGFLVLGVEQQPFPCPVATQEA